MSLDSKDCGNSKVEAGPSDPDMSDAKYYPVKELQSLSLETGDEDIENEQTEVMSEEQTDENDGLLNKIGKAVGIVKKKSWKREEKRPFSKTEGTSIHSGQLSSETKLIQRSYCYNFSNQQRGYLLLVINEKFCKCDPRKGAHFDIKNMNSFADRFGFIILNEGSERNLTQSGTMSWLKKAQSIDHSDCDCFMFVISTHGDELPNPKKGGRVDHALVCADDKLIFTSTIIEMFNETNCPSLKGKPKIFIIQACREKGLDDGVKIVITKEETRGISYRKDISIDHGSDVAIANSKDKLRGITSDSKEILGVTEATGAPLNLGISYTDGEEDTQANKSETSRKMGRDSDVSDSRRGEDSWNNNTSPCLKCDDDMLVMYAIPPGMLAWRSSGDGSWMIHYLHEELMAYDMKAPTSFLRVLTKVSAKMSQRTSSIPDKPKLHEKKAVPVIEHRLTRDILFAHKH